MISTIVFILYVGFFTLICGIVFRGWPVNKTLRRDTYTTNSNVIPEMQTRYMVVMESRLTGDVQMGEHPTKYGAVFDANIELTKGNLLYLKGLKNRRSLKKMSKGRF
jgi:hypothetical protein